MAKYILINQSPYSIQLTIPGPPRRNAVQVNIPSSMSIDILPWAGSIRGCRNIAFIHDLIQRGLARVEEE